MKFNNIEIKENGSSQLLVSFGGIKAGMGMPVFEFYNSLKYLDCDKVFIKDINQAWYHKGINEEVNSIESVKDLLSVFISNRSYKNIVFIGNSMGGYAAILFGTILNVNHVLAFSPQTFIDRYNRFRFNDSRWKKELSKVYLNNRHQKEFYNLKSFLKKVNSSTQIHVYYSENSRLDSVHSNRIKNIDKVSLFPFKIGDHNLIKKIRDEGKLLSIINNVIYN